MTILRLDAIAWRPRTVRAFQALAARRQNWNQRTIETRRAVVATALLDAVAIVGYA